MKLGLRGKILLIVGPVVVATVLAITVLAGRFFSDAYSRALASRSEAISHEVAVQFERLLALGLRADEIVGFDDVCAKVMQGHSDLSFVAVVALDGNYLFHSSAERQVLAPAIVNDLLHSKLVTIPARSGKGSTRVSSMPVRSATGETVGIVLVAHAEEVIASQLATLYRTAFGVGLSLLLVGLGILFWAVSRFINRPLHDVVGAVDSLRADQLDTTRRIEVQADSELGVLVDGFNRLLERLASHERSLVEAKDLADAASRAKSEFLATISHELRTPLNGILGMNALLLRSQLDEKQRRYAAMVEVSGQSLLEIIEEILDYSHIEAGSLRLDSQVFSLREASTRVIDGLEALAHRKELSLSLTVDPTCPDRMAGDAKRVRQVLTNLLGNAIKFTDTGFVRLNVRPAGGEWIEFIIEDSGIGIAADKHSLIFEPFRQADGGHNRKYGGTGLGLTITRRLVEAMHGSITLESIPQRGTSFHVRLPLAAVAKSVAPAEAKAP